ncbi:hypothetical protein [Hyphococcus luteus]|uniref:Uncharacterized protein n=1 Tax=Hyphococcus luteus TaxID=2058213 RepID=A0A2S7JZX3_9PROT|nr:hypothetical protein [Marinicaulis flavus]PQA85797.1 hypothetical protein CW354_19815 [Marinicaulis flavus]
MFDYSPRDAQSPFFDDGQSASRSPAMKPGRKAAPDKPRPFEIVALWGENAAELRRAIDNETDWGPFELAEMKPLGHDAFGALRILCRFDYHGDASARSHFEDDLRARLSTITCWKEAPHPQDL